MMQNNNSEESNLPTGLSKPALRALAGAGIARLEQMSGISEVELLNLHGMGPKGIKLIRLALEETGLSFAEKS